MTLLVNHFLATILSASLYATLLAPLILLLQKLTAKILPARYRFALWFLVLIRLTPIPLPESPYSLLNFLPSLQTHSPLKESALTLKPWIPPPPTPVPSPDPAFSLIPVPNNPDPNIDATPHPFTQDPAISPKTPAAIPHFPPFIQMQNAPPQSTPLYLHFLLPLYLLGLSLVLLRQLLATLSLKKILRNSTLSANPPLLQSLISAKSQLRITRPLPLLLTQNLTTPALVGLLHPRLLLPAHLLTTCSPEDLHHIFLHECAHLRRKDILLNYYLALLAALHWFNPALWILLPRIKADRELAADELVLLHLPNPNTYGQTLLNLLTTTPIPRSPSAVPILNSKSHLKRRITMIANFHKTPRWLLLPTTLLLLTLAALTLTTAADPAPATKPSPGIETLGSPAPAPQPDFSHTIKYTSTPTHFQTGDSLTITEIRGPSETMSTPGVYQIKGTVTLNSQNTATLAAYVTTDSKTPDPIATHHSLTITKGKSDFTLELYIADEGQPHISIYPGSGQQSTSSLYFGIGPKHVLNEASVTPLTSATQPTPDAPQESKADAAFHKRYKEFSTDHLPLEKACAQFHELTGIPLAIDWEQLAAIGIDKNTPITANFHDATAADIFIQMTMNLGKSHNPPLSFNWILGRDGVLTFPSAIITDPPIPGPNDPITRYYDVRSLVVAPTTPDAALNADQRAAVDQILNAITLSVSPESWKHDATISAVNGILIVTARKNVQDKITSFIINLDGEMLKRRAQLQLDSRNKPKAP